MAAAPMAARRLGTAVSCAVASAAIAANISATAMNSTNRFDVYHLHAALLDESAGDRHRFVHLLDQQRLRRLVIRQSRRDENVAFPVENRNRIPGLGAGGGACLLGGAPVAAFEVAPHVDRLAGNGGS